MQTETTISFISGLHTIGSNIVCLEHGDYRLITDFGVMSGASDDDLFDSKRTETLIAKDQLPMIDGIYDAAQVPDGLVEPLSDSSVKTIVCISHLHIDHVGSLYHLSSHIPVYATQTAVKFYQALVAAGQLPEYNVNWQVAPADTFFEHGPFRIQFHESDHDTLGSASIFIEAPDLKVIHSGDLRLGGFHPETVLKWVTQASEWAPDLFLLEGTSFSHEGEVPDVVDIELEEITSNIDAMTEIGLLNNMAELLRNNPDHLFAINGYPQNMERFFYLAHLLQADERQLVLQPDFYQLYRVSVGNEVNVIEMSVDITAEDIQTNPNNYLVQIDESNYQQLFELPQGIYLHSNGAPLGSYMASYEPFVRSIVSNGWDFYHANVSGHATQADLLTIAYTVNSKLTVPWHTFKPDLFAEELGKRGVAYWIPAYHDSYTASEVHDLIQKGGDLFEN